MEINTFPIDVFKNLPAIEKKKNGVEKRAIELSSLDDLMTGQKVVFEKLQDFILEDGGGLFLLQGYAGTGKTYLISKFVEWYLYTLQTNQVIVTAPTNKAVKVLREIFEFTNTNLKYSTIHKLLGLKEVIDQDGKQSFQSDASSSASVDKYSLVVIDEVSMLNDELFDLIYPFVKSDDLKIVLVGDFAQIPPINKNECIPFNEEWQDKLNITKATLIDIIRQVKNNPIIDLSMRIRDNLGKHISIKVSDSKVVSDNGLLILEKDNFSSSEVLHDLIVTLFTSKNFEYNSDFVKIIAWRNKVVDFMNDYVRKIRWGSVARIVVGEKLLANSPIFKNDDILFSTNDEFEVIGFKVDNKVITSEKNNKGSDRRFKIDYYLTDVKYVSPIDGKEIVKSIKIVHEDSDPVYQFLLMAFAEIAKGTEGGYARKKAWKEFYNFKKYFADVKYNYAITAHKSQGSTYDNVIIMGYDINKNKKIVECNRIKYTSITRASKNLVVVV